MKGFSFGLGEVREGLDEDDMMKMKVQNANRTM